MSGTSDVTPSRSNSSTSARRKTGKLDQDTLRESAPRQGEARCCDPGVPLSRNGSVM
jgi:hypothetical protein